MKIKDKILSTSNITFVADKLFTSFLTNNYFSDFLPTPQNFVQIPNFALMEFGNCNFIVDVDNRRVIINHKGGKITESKVPNMAKKFITEIKTIEPIAIGFNYVTTITCDSSFWKYSLHEFLSKKYKDIIGDELSGVGVKSFIKRSTYNITFAIEPSAQSPDKAIANANFHYEIHQMANLDVDFLDRYNEFEGLINGFFS